MSQRILQPRIVKIHPSDNAAVAVNDEGLAEGLVLEGGLRLLDFIPQGHKVAVRDLKKGDEVVRYGVVIGLAKDDIAKGGRIRDDMLNVPPAPELDALLPAEIRPYAAPEPLTGYTFEGFKNLDGTVGTLNLLAIGTSINCVEGVVDVATRRIERELLPKYPNVDGVVAVQHTYGCGQSLDAKHSAIPDRTLRNFIQNPNFGGVPMIVSLGCEKYRPETMLPPGAVPLEVKGQHLVTLQDESCTSFDSMIKQIMDVAEKRLRFLNNRKRETCPASGLVVGMQCGGSDSFSGISANPVLGRAADLIIRAGGTVMFSELPEVRDRVDLLVERAASQEVAEALVNEMRWYDSYLDTFGLDRSTNTSPGNKKGGIANIAEKSMGNVVKSGTTPLVGVLSPGEKLPPNHTPGLYFCSTPGSDFYCGTIQVAAGMNMHVFSTGRGTPYGLAEVPVVKVSTRTALARQWFDLIDVDAGRLFDGIATIEEMAWDMFRFILDVAGGKKKTFAQRHGIRNRIALFYPGPLV